MIAILLATTISITAPVQVAPADPAAYFKGDGTALKFDPACRNYTLDDVQLDPACAARFERGELGPMLAIAVNSLRSKTKTAEVIERLDRAAAASNSPAAHYLLGSILGTAEQVRPNYQAAVTHLGIAAAHGNPAAADLLASLLIAGKGGARNIPRAIGLYEFAAANGFPSAAVSLGKLYLAGKFVPRDDARGLAWLEAAAAVNVPTAAQLAALARNQAKVSNYQLIPSPSPAKVKVVKYGMFDNPDIPPNFGFDPDLQAVHDEPFNDLTVLARLEKGAASMPTPYLYELARRIAARDPNKGLETYLLARTRMTYDASRCADPAAGEALRAWDLAVGADLRFLFASGRPTRALVDRVLAEEAKLAGDTQPWWVCRSGMGHRVRAGRQGA